MTNGTPNKRQTMFVRCALLSLLFCVCQPLSASAESDFETVALKGRYFLIVWAYQGPDDDLVHAHTFTSFYRGSDLSRGIVRPATISWLPASRAVQPFGAERGHNYSLDQTLRMACQSGRRVKAWGPYEIRSELFQRAMRRMQLLESGNIGYSMINDLPKAMNCISASGDITPTPLQTGILWGEAASAEVVRHLSPYFIGDESVTLKSLIAMSTKTCPGQTGQVVINVDGNSVP